MNKKSLRKNREDYLKELCDVKYDLFIIGGGCVGSGCALDGVTRGLKVCLIEENDFSSFTSSKSTKLLHGGVRYLEKGISKLDFNQIKLVYEALKERYTILRIAPYLTDVISITTPIYENKLIIYYYFLLKLYDFLSGIKSLGKSYYLSRNRLASYYRKIKDKNLKGAIIYTDGVMNDTRLNLMLALTSEYYGSTILNYFKLIKFLKKDDKIQKAICKDILTNKEYEISSKVFISASGSFTDKIRNLSEKHKNIMIHSKGTHIVLKPEYSPYKMGIIDNKTKDNRMLFIIPWKNKIIAGATENITKLKPKVKPEKREIKFILNEVQKFCKVKIYKKDILSSFSGIRPLVKDNSKINSESIVREYKLIDDKNNLISIVGGKWTLYRLMSEKTIDLAIKNYNLNPKNMCLTEYLQIIGSNKYSKDLFYKISSDLNVSLKYSKYLLNNYGSLAFKLKNYLQSENTKISEKYLFTVNEVLYCIQNECACTISDIISRRSLLSILDVNEAKKAVYKVGNVFKDHFGWSKDKYEKEIKNSIYNLREFGLNLK